LYGLYNVEAIQAYRDAGLFDPSHNSRADLSTMAK